MKQIIAIFLCVICLHSSAQTTEKNLKLVGMITRDTSLPTTFPFEFNYQVPEGKIWKIDNLLFRGYNSSYIGIQIMINESVIFNNVVLTSYNELNNSPLWLNSGDVITIKSTSSSVSVPNFYNFRMAGFEFVLE